MSQLSSIQRGILRPKVQKWFGRQMRQSVFLGMRRQCVHNKSTLQHRLVSNFEGLRLCISVAGIADAHKLPQRNWTKEVFAAWRDRFIVGNDPCTISDTSLEEAAAGQVFVFRSTLQRPGWHVQIRFGAMDPDSQSHIVFEPGEPLRIEPPARSRRRGQNGPAPDNSSIDGMFAAALDQFQPPQ